MQIFQLKMATFPVLIVRFFVKIKTVEAIDKMDKLCKFHEYPTKNENFIFYIRETGNANFQLKMVTFPSLIGRVSKSIGLELLIRRTSCVSFTKIRPKM